MKTLDEWMKISDGGQFSTALMQPNERFEPKFRHVASGFPVWHGIMYECDGSTRATYFHATIVQGWTRWHPPKKAKKVTMCRPIRKGSRGLIIYEPFEESKDYFLDGPVQPIVGWQEIECEVDW